MMERRLAAHLPLVALHHPSRARPQRREARRHQAPAALHRLGQPPALLAHRSRTPHVLPRRHVAEGRPHLDDPHRRHPQHAHPQAHHGHGDCGPRVLGTRRRNHLVRLAVSQGRRLLPRQLQPEDRQAHRLSHAARRLVDSLQPDQGSRPLLRRRRRSRPGGARQGRRVDRALPSADDRRSPRTRSTARTSGSPASSTPSTWSTCRTTTTAKSPTSASRRTRSSSSSPATCSGPATSSASKSQRPSIRRPRMCSPRPTWRASSIPVEPTPTHVP